MVSGAAVLLNEDGRVDLFVDHAAPEMAFELSSVVITVNQDAGSGRLDAYGAFGYGLMGF